MPFRADRAVGLIRQSMEQGRLAHAYLVTGPREAELETVASRIIGSVSGLEQRKSLDGWIGRGATVLRPNSKSRRIVIGDDANDIGSMRWFLNAMNLSVEAGTHRYGVIVDAERMNAQTQNAFLKTLEEPPKQTLLLLLTHKPDELLTTILSRVIELEIMPEPGERIFTEQEKALLALLQQNGQRSSPSMAGALGLKAGFEAVLDALRESVEDEQKADFEKEKTQYGKTTDGTYLKTREDQMKAMVETSYLQQRDALVELMVAWLGDIVRQKAKSDSLDLPAFSHVTAPLAEKHEMADLLKRVQALRRLESNLHTSVNENLALEVAFIEAFG
jgi:DNA polymerase III subunit delta'